MITDNLLMLSGTTSATTGVTTGQDLSQVAANYISENVVDTGNATNIARDMGEGESLYIVFTVTEAFTSGGAATVAINCVVSPATALTGSTTVGSVAATAVASLTLGTQFVVRINPLVASLGLRYLGVIYTIATATTTAGAMTAYVVKDFQDGKKFYKSGFELV
jgi:hypothetical protein